MPESQSWRPRRVRLQYTSERAARLAPEKRSACAACGRASWTAFCDACVTKRCPRPAPDARQAEHESRCGRRLQLVAAFPCDRSDETRIKRLLADYRARGEWFHPSRFVQGFVGVPLVPSPAEPCHAPEPDPNPPVAFHDPVQTSGIDPRPAPAEVAVRLLRRGPRAARQHPDQLFLPWAVSPNQGGG